MGKLFMLALLAILLKNQAPDPKCDLDIKIPIYHVLKYRSTMLFIKPKERTDKGLNLTTRYILINISPAVTR